MRTDIPPRKIKMACRYLATLLKPQLAMNFTFSDVRQRFLHTSPALFKVRAGKVRKSPKGDQPVSYEEFLHPPTIAHRKSWNSWNTSTIEGGRRCWEILTDDLFIRKFMQGTFRGSVLSKVIIKRQHNIIRIAAILKRKLPASRMGFLIGYTEEMLSIWFHCIVKLEIQTVNDFKALTLTYV